MKKKKWIINIKRPLNINTDELNISKLTGYALESKGYDTTESAKAFLEQKEETLLDPFLLKDMQTAVDTIKESISNNEKIVVYGDYDVDGITSSVILTNYLETCGANVKYYIPDRIEEGYGLNKQALTNLMDEGTNLFITVDCGITAVDEVLHVINSGAKIIVTDHHSCKEEIPKATAIVNPKQPNCTYPYKELAGVGVAFKLICALMGDSDKALADYSDIVALGTIADVMPLTFENRTIVSAGIEKLQTTTNVGLKALFKEAKVRSVSSSAVGFKIAPRLNAAGRMGKATEAAKLLLSDDEIESTELAISLCEQNFDRQDEEQGILSTVLNTIENDIDITTDKIIVVAGDHFHHGVVGIVSSRVTEKYYLPSIILSVDGDTAKGSARSVDSFNMFENLCKVEHLLLKFGGHKIAAGLSVATENIDLVRNELLKIAEESLTQDDLTPKLLVDACVPLSDIDLQSIKSLEKLEPYGVSNPEPIFVSQNVVIKQIAPLAGGKFTKFLFSQDNSTIECLAFSTTPAEFLYKVNDTIDIAYTVSINDFNGIKSAQLLLKDYRASEFTYQNEQKSIELYNRFKNGLAITPDEKVLLTPSREDFSKVYKLLKISPRNFNIKDHARKLGMSICRYMVSLDCFKDAKLCQFAFLEDIASLKLLDAKEKVVLEETTTYKNLENK